MSAADEPLFGPGTRDTPPRDGIPLRERIRRLMQEEPYGVLSTQGEGQPYGSLLAFAATDDLSRVVFGTPVTTRKYRLLSACDHVAVLVDNRSSRMGNMMEIEAVTATGRAVELERGAEFDRWSALLLARQPSLAHFVEAPSCALFRIDITRYFHVVRFQEVRQWIPNPAG